MLNSVIGLRLKVMWGILSLVGIILGLAGAFFWVCLFCALWFHSTGWVALAITTGVGGYVFGGFVAVMLYRKFWKTWDIW